MSHVREGEEFLLFTRPVQPECDSKALKTSSNFPDFQRVHWRFSVASKDGLFHREPIHGYNSHEEGEPECAA